jgi:hypothetical protein
VAGEIKKIRDKNEDIKGDREKTTEEEINVDRRETEKE